MKKSVSGLKFCMGGLVTALSLFCSNAHASLEYRQVTAEGRGPSLGAAVNEALVEAVGQVNGKTVDASSMLSSIDLSSSDGEEEKHFSSEAFQRSVASATKGAVASYDIVSSSETETGRWNVTVTAKVAKYKRSAKSQRKRIAVMPLEISASQFSFSQQAKDSREAVRVLGDSLNARLVQSRRFTVLDRSYQKNLLNENKLILSGNTRVEEAARLGEELVSDYLVVGSLEDVSLKEKSHTFPSGKVVRSYAGTVSVSIRLIEVATRQVAWAEVLNVSVSSKSKEASTSEIMEPVADQISEKILDAIYPIIVVQVRGDLVILGQGGEGIKEGERYKVYRYGDRMVDPYNGEFLGREEIYCADIEVERVLSKQSYAKVLSSDVDLAAAFAPKTLVCRSAGMGRDAVSTGKQRMESVKKLLDSNW